MISAWSFIVDVVFIVMLLLGTHLNQKEAVIINTIVQRCNVT